MSAFVQHFLRLRADYFAAGKGPPGPPGTSGGDLALTGDVTGSGPNVGAIAATVVKVHGTAVPATPAADTALVATDGTHATWAKIGSANIAAGAIVDANVNAAAAIAGSKITPTFGAQDETVRNITSTGTITATGSIDAATSLKADVIDAHLAALPSFGDPIAIRGPLQGRASVGLRYLRNLVAMADADYDYTAAYGAVPILDVSGALTADRAFKGPKYAGYRVSVYNRTTGGKALLVSPAAGGASVKVPSGAHALVYCDGNDYLPESFTPAGSPPADAQVLAWNAATSAWEPTAPAQVIASGQEYEFGNVASDVGGYDVWSNNATGAEADLSSGLITIGSGKTLIKAFATSVGEPDVTLIPAGRWSFLCYRYTPVVGTGTTLVLDVYKRAAGGAETLLFSVNGAQINDTTVAAETITYAQAADIVLLATDRLVVKVSAITTNVVGVAVHFVFDGTTHASYGKTPIVGGAIPVGGDLSGNVDNATVAKVNGVAANVVPAAGYVPVATSATAFSWSLASTLSLLTGITIPDVGATVSANLGTGALAVNDLVWLHDATGNASAFQVQSITDAANAVLVNVSGPGSAAPGAAIAAGAVGRILDGSFAEFMSSYFGAGDGGTITPGASGTTTLGPWTYPYAWSAWPAASTAKFTNAAAWSGLAVITRTKMDWANAPAGAFTCSIATAAGNASGATGGAAGAAALQIQQYFSTNVGTAGANGVNGAGSSPAALSLNSVYCGGAVMAVGANGGAGANAGGTGQSPSAAFSMLSLNAGVSIFPVAPVFAAGRFSFQVNGAVPGGSGAPGGGSGAATGGGAGAGGMGGAGFYFAVPQWNRDGTTAALAIVCNGGNGGNGGNGAAAVNTGGGGAGAGGAGGATVRTTCVLTGTPVSNMLQHDGGSGGNGGNGGTGGGGVGGTGGMSGNLIDLKLVSRAWTTGPATSTISANAGTAGGAASGTTGGTGSAGGQGRIAA